MANIILFFLSLLLSQIKGQSQVIKGNIPNGASDATAVATYSYQTFVDAIDQTEKILFDITLKQNKWVGFGFASSSGTSASNLFMTGTYAWVFANFDWGTLPNKLSGSVVEYTLSNHAIGDPVFPKQITTRNAFSDVSQGQILHTIQVIRPIAVRNKYTIPTSGESCLIYAIGSEWYWYKTMAPQHTDKGIICNTISASTNPTKKPTYYPTAKPTNEPTPKPTGQPTKVGKTANPTPRPTGMPSTKPTDIPSKTPTVKPTGNPTVTGQTKNPSGTPTANPSFEPTKKPTDSKSPTKAADKQATNAPSQTPTESGFAPDADEPTPLTQELTQTEQILIIVGGFLLLVCCFGLTFYWFHRSSQKKAQEKKKKREKMEELAKKQAEIYVADNPDAVPSTTGVAKSNKKSKKYDDSDDSDEEFSGDADTDDELKKKYGKYMDSDSDNSSEDSYLKKKKARTNATSYDDSESDEDDSDSDIPARYRKKGGKKSKFASGGPAKSSRKVIKSRKNKYYDSDSD